jgi:hypothetical protein
MEPMPKAELQELRRRILEESHMPSSEELQAALLAMAENRRWTVGKGKIKAGVVAASLSADDVALLDSELKTFARPPKGV